MHENWKNNILGYDISEGGVPRLEIDESKIIGNQNKVYWMFGIIDRSTKDCRVFCVLDNRSRETLIPLVIKNVFTNNDLGQLIIKKIFTNILYQPGYILIFWLLMTKKTLKTKGIYFIESIILYGLEKGYSIQIL